MPKKECFRYFSSEDLTLLSQLCFFVECVTAFFINIGQLDRTISNIFRYKYACFLPVPLIDIFLDTYFIRIFPCLHKHALKGLSHEK